MNNIPAFILGKFSTTCSTGLKRAFDPSQLNTAFDSNPLDLLQAS